jgi:hypothetical protein
MSRGVLCQFFIITVLLKLAYQKVLYPQVIYYRCGYKNIQYYLMVNSFTHARLCFQPGIFAFNLKKSRKFFCKFCIFNILTVIVAKGEQRSHRPKGGENVKPNNHEQSKQHAFDSFCKKILKHEARDFYDELKRQRSRVVGYVLKPSTHPPDTSPITKGRTCEDGLVQGENNTCSDFLALYPCCFYRPTMG